MCELYKIILGALTQAVESFPNNIRVIEKNTHTLTLNIKLLIIIILQYISTEKRNYC